MSLSCYNNSMCLWYSESSTLWCNSFPVDHSLQATNSVSLSLASTSTVYSCNLHTLQLLRKQLVYNALIGSCLGRSKRGIPPPSTAEVTEFIFELMSIPPNQVMVTMDMQSEETMIGRVLTTTTLVLSTYLPSSLFLPPSLPFPLLFAVNFVVPDQNPTAVEVRIKTSLDSSPVVQAMLSEVAQR